MLRFEYLGQKGSPIISACTKLDRVPSNEGLSLIGIKPPVFEYQYNIFNAVEAHDPFAYHFDTQGIAVLNAGRLPGRFPSSQGFTPVL